MVIQPPTPSDPVIENPGRPEVPDPQQPSFTPQPGGPEIQEPPPAPVEVPQPGIARPSPEQPSPTEPPGQPGPGQPGIGEPAIRTLPPSTTPE
jgi:hypothetical protein